MVVDYSQFTSKSRQPPPAMPPAEQEEEEEAQGECSAASIAPVVSQGVADASTSQADQEAHDGDTDS